MSAFKPETIKIALESIVGQLAERYGLKASLVPELFKEEPNGLDGDVQLGRVHGTSPVQNLATPEQELAELERRA